MKTLDQWLDEYSISHQNKTNQMLHKLFVPLIFLSALGMLWDWQYMDVRAAYVMAFFGMIFYISLGAGVAILMLVQVGLSFAILRFWSQQQGSIFLPNLYLFIFAWAGQFLGHKIEGKKPSFFKDLQFLLIGPVWVFAFAFRKSR
ncbi:MAG: DUF962 domain-containing protein [Bdellovibrionaceae bacterium]|nr:DUF962 domain-containing protein [Pseudobdellovibrionaceae bacterium]